MNKPEEISVVLENPFTMFIAGPTKSGKTTFVDNLLANASQYYSDEPNLVFYFYNMHKPTHPRLLKNVDQFIEGVPSKEWLKDVHFHYGKNLTIVIDDQAMSLSDELAELFTVGSSRAQANIIFITQNLFMPAKQARTISLNCNYFVIFKNPRDVQAAQNFLKQLEGNTKTLCDIYADATSEPHSYLFIDLHQKTRSENRFLSNIFSENEKPPVLYRC